MNVPARSTKSITCTLLEPVSDMNLITIAPVEVFGDTSACQTRERFIPDQFASAETMGSSS